MNFFRTLIVALSLMGAAIGLAVPATASDGWDPGRESMLNDAQDQIVGWAASIGKPAPNWVHSQGPCITNPSQFCKGTIYISSLGATRWWNIDGWRGIWFIAGHEASHSFGKGAESGATCGSGAFFRWLVNTHVISDADVQYFINQMQYNQPDPEHGSAAAQQAQFRSGYDSGNFDAC